MKIFSRRVHIKYACREALLAENKMTRMEAESERGYGISCWHLTFSARVRSMPFKLRELLEKS